MAVSISVSATERKREKRQTSAALCLTFLGRHDTNILSISKEGTADMIWKTQTLQMGKGSTEAVVGDRAPFFTRNA